MSKTFIYLGNNEAREKGEVEQPSGSNIAEWGIYSTYVNNLPRIKVNPDLAKTLKEGQEIVEGVDCREEWLLSYGQGATWYDKSEYESHGNIEIQDKRLSPIKEERNEAIEFAEWITYQGYDSFQIAIQIKWSKGKYQPDFTTQQLYELFKTRKQ